MRRLSVGKKQLSWSALIALLGLAGGLFANHGLKPVTQEQAEYIKQHWPKVIGIKANKIGAQRIRDRAAAQGKLESSEFSIAQSPEEEFITSLSAEDLGDKTLTALSPDSLPRAVDNSQLPCFPPIGDQKQLGSCVGWASTYYLASHEIGLLNGFNNKEGSTHLLSPKWTYNLLNGGEDGGLYILDAYELLAQNGATTVVNFPYDEDYLSWDLNPQDWVSAISNRTTTAQLIEGVDTKPQNLTLIKQLLNNGHLLTFGTFVNSWVYSTVKKDPYNNNQPFVGQKAVSWGKGQEGGHHVTIVGYNDDIWIDINGNGKVDPGERGAFLVANSWGKGWGNQGFIWIAYDAFLSTSAVAGGPSAGRVPVGAAFDSKLISIVPKALNYTPTLVAQFSVGQSERNQLAVSAGVSSQEDNRPVESFANKFFDFSGGAYRFDGKDSDKPISATFALDLTDLAAHSELAPQRFYLLVNDGKEGAPTTLNSYSLLDLANKAHVDCKQLPLQFDDALLAPFIDYAFSGALHIGPPSVAITSPLSHTDLSGTVQVVANATSAAGIERVDLFVDGVLQNSDPTSPYLFSFDTTQFPNGMHTLTAVAYDARGVSTSHAVSVHTGNYPANTYINVGGEAATYADVSWEKDRNYSGRRTGCYRSSLPFDNPIYTTERFGNFSYSFAVANGKHNVKLKFAENWFQGPGKRIFNVFINGEKVASNLDLYKEAGFGVPYDLVFPVEVTDHVIKIDFVSVVNRAKVNGIAITIRK